jgi:hypothetical protein
LNLFHRNPGPLPEADLLLGQALDLTAATTPAGVRVARLLGELARRGRWLVVFDSAEDPRALSRLLPEGPDQGADHVTQPGLAPDADGQHLRTCQAAAPLRDQQCGLDAR